MRFTGKVAIVTGGAGSVGRAISLLLAQEESKVTVADLNLENAKKVVSELRDMGAEGLAIKLDVTSLSSVKKVMETVYEKYGKIDILVNNAGWDKMEPFMESKEEDWELAVDINFRGQVNCTSAVLDYMIERRQGKIINMASEAGRTGTSGRAVYSGAKGGVIAFTKAIAYEMASYKINVNCVAPGVVDTPRLDSLRAGNPKLMHQVIASIPWQRLGKPEEIAQAVAFFASDEANYITGQTLGVNGGLAMF